MMIFWGLLLFFFLIINFYCFEKVRRSDVLSAWSGIRPLVRDPAKSSTEGLARNHLVISSKSGLITSKIEIKTLGFIFSNFLCSCWWEMDNLSFHGL